MKATIPFIASLIISAAFVSGGPAPTFAAEQASERPLLVVRFNQDHVYYTRALKQAVANAERAKSGVRYHVVSYLPDGKRRGQKQVASKKAQGNLDKITGLMQQLGVDASRIEAKSQKAPVMNQEIKIYVE